jgi:hypothetical protein
LVFSLVAGHKHSVSLHLAALTQTENSYTQNRPNTMHKKCMRKFERARPNASARQGIIG